MMDILTFISHLAHSLAWPVVVALFLLITRHPLRELIFKLGNLRDIELKYKDATIKYQLSELQTNLGALKSLVGVEDNTLIKEKIDAMLKKMEDDSKTFTKCILEGYDQGKCKK